MDVEQVVVFRPEGIMGLVDKTLRRLGEGRANVSHSLCRLVAFELLFSPEMLEYNAVLKTTCGLYERRDVTPDVCQGGIFILRAPLLALVTMLLNMMSDVSHSEMMCAIVHQFPQETCCWYNVSKKKACACAAESDLFVRTSIVDGVDDVPIARQSHEWYLTCHKHWSPVLRQAAGERSTMYPSSETNLDEWLGWLEVVSAAKS